MRSKSWLVILIIGVVGFCALGFLTKFALESNPSLVRFTKLKQAIADDFSSQGIGRVGVRSLPQRRGLELRVEASRGAQRDPAALTVAIAEDFLRRYTGPVPPYVKLSLEEPGRMGCEGSVAYFEKEYSTVELAATLELRAAVQRWEASISATGRLRPLSWEPGDPLKLSVEVPEPKDDAELERVLSLLRARAGEHLAAGRGRTVLLSVWSAAPPRRLLREERLERPGRLQRRVSAPVPPAPAPEPVSPPVTPLPKP